MACDHPDWISCTMCSAKTWVWPSTTHTLASYAEFSDTGYRGKHRV